MSENWRNTEVKRDKHICGKDLALRTERVGASYDYLERPVARCKRSLYPRVARGPLKVAYDYRPPAFQVGQHKAYQLCERKC